MPTCGKNMSLNYLVLLMVEELTKPKNNVMSRIEKMVVQALTTEMRELVAESLTGSPRLIWEYWGSGGWSTSDGLVDVKRYFYNGTECYSIAGESPEGHTGKHYSVGHFDGYGEWHAYDCYNTVEEAFADAGRLHARLMCESET